MTYIFQKYFEAFAHFGEVLNAKEGRCGWEDNMVPHIQVW